MASNFIWIEYFNVEIQSENDNELRCGESSYNYASQTFSQSSIRCKGYR